MKPESPISLLSLSALLLSAIILAGPCTASGADTPATSATSSLLSTSGTTLENAPSPDAYFPTPASLIPNGSQPDSSQKVVPFPSSEATAKTTPSASEQLKKSAAANEAYELKERIHFRKVKTIAQSDPAVEKQLQLADSAGTIPEKNRAMHHYYNLLYAKILAIDPSLASASKKSKDEAIRRLEKTEPADLNPPVHGKIW